MSLKHVRNQFVLRDTKVFTGTGNFAFTTQAAVVVKKAVGAATQVTLPKNPYLGHMCLVKDGKGDAATNNITVVGATGNIDGAANFVISENYGKAIFQYNGTEWGVLTTAEVSAAEVGFLNGVTAGTVTASKAVVVGTNKEIDTIVLPVSGLKIGAGAGTAVDRSAAQLNALAQGVAANYKIARGQHTTVAASDTVATGLATVVSVVVSFESDPVVDPMLVSAQVGDQAGAPVAGSIIIKTWQPTDAAGADSDATPTAATTFSKKVNWIAVGT